MAAPVPMAVSREVWEVAEQASELILNKIRPTIADDQYRRDVTSFVSGLLKSHFQCEVVIFVLADLIGLVFGL